MRLRRGVGVAVLGERCADIVRGGGYKFRLSQPD
jgi:hypothetical protein